MLHNMNDQDAYNVSASDQTTAQRIAYEIAEAWDISSPASVFPARYHPDPDASNWGVGLLSAIRCLAKMTRGDKEGAVELVVESVEEQSKGTYRVHEEQYEGLGIEGNGANV